MSDPITQAAIQARAYQLWEESGCVDGNHEEHWRHAEAECAAKGDEMAAVVAHDGAAMPPEIDGEASPPPEQTAGKLRRWPTPIAEV